MKRVPNKTGIELIRAERAEQIEKHGRDLDHDKAFNADGQLLAAATALDCPKYLHRLRNKPRAWDKNIWERMIGKSKVERLTIAGALLMAENERLGSKLYERLINDVAAEIDRIYNNQENESLN